MRWFIAFLPAVLLATLTAGCTDHAQPVTQSGRPAAPHLETLVVAPEIVAKERIWDGVVEAVYQATLSAQTAGRIRELPVDVNDIVQSGQVVARFTDVEQRSGKQQAEAALRSAEAAYAEAQFNFTRIEQMLADELVSRAAYDQALARRDAARAALAAARAAVSGAGEQVEYTLVRAPYAGIVTERQVQVGEAVQPGQPLLSLLSLDRLRLHVEIPQSEVAAVRAHGRAVVLLDDGRRIEAERVIVFPQADPATHSFRVRVELPEQETGLQPGAIAKVAFVLGETQRLLLPASTLRQRSEVSTVYVVDADGVVRLRQVRPGHRYGDRVEILAGLTEGERVVKDPIAALTWLAAQRKGEGNG